VPCRKAIAKRGYLLKEAWIAITVAKAFDGSRYGAFESHDVAHGLVWSEAVREGCVETQDES
jgi:hypothetical protein